MELDPFEEMERRRAAKSRQRAQQERIGRLRGRVISVSLITFALLWGIVFVQMATGNDPVLNSASRTAAAAARRATKAPRNHTASDQIEAEPQETEVEVVEPEVAEPEFEETAPEAVEPEFEEVVPEEVEAVEPEPAPVITSQS